MPHGVPHCPGDVPRNRKNWYTAKLSNGGGWRRLYSFYVPTVPINILINKKGKEPVAVAVVVVVDMYVEGGVSQMGQKHRKMAATLSVAGFCPVPTAKTR